MDLETEYQYWQDKVNEAQRRIFIVKDELIELYDSDHLSPILPHRKRKLSLAARNVSESIYTIDAMKCCFYQTFMTAREKHHSTNIVVTYPTEDKTVYGVELNREANGKF